MIDVYALRMQNKLTDEQLSILTGLVSSEKKERIKRYFFWEDAQRTLLGDILIRRIVQKRLQVSNADLVFEKNEYGKPYLVGYPQIKYNISHSGEWIVCSIGEKNNGIDVEKTKKFDIKLAKRIFQQHEYRSIVNLSQDEQDEAFFRLWTLKESYIKCIGRGLSMSLDAFGFCINAEDIFLCGDEKRYYKFKQFQILNNYYISVCASDESINTRVYYMSTDEMLLG